MLRFVAAIVIGYVVMLVLVFGLFMAAYPLFGVDRLFAPGSYQAGAGWIAMSFVIGLAAASSGGSVSARIAPGTSAPLWLATIVLVLGGLMAIPVAMSASHERGGIRPPETTMAEAIARAEQPLWVALLNPILGAVGVLAGAGPRGRSQP